VVAPPIKVAEPIAGGPDVEAVKKMVLAAVAEKTGYPVEMLDLELDLEADLGIDTVKQAELFATVRETYGIPRREELRLSDYNTLNKVIQFVLDSYKNVVTPAIPVEDDEPPLLQENNPAPHKADILRRVPVAVLRPRLDLCQPTTVTLDASSRVLLVAEPGKQLEALARKLRARKVLVFTLSTLDLLNASQESIKSLLPEGPLQGVYFLGDLTRQSSLVKTNFETWQLEINHRAGALYRLFHTLTDVSFLVCATRLGGLFGVQASNGTCLDGLVSGFSKALALERPQMLVKVLDFEDNLAPSNLAERLINETLADAGCVEIGWKDGLRYGISQLESLAPVLPDLELPEGSVFVVSGGSGGIISPVVQDLAQTTHGTFFLLSRTRLPDAADADLARLKNDRKGLLAEMMQRLLDSGLKATPALAEQKLEALERAAATLETIKSLQAAGAKAHYIVCDVTDPASVQAAVAQIGAISPRVDVFIHAAGLERSRRLENKPLDEFNATIAVKAHGFFNLFKSLQNAALLPRAVVLFGSVAGRFGNAGQTDYAAANDLLNKIAAALHHDYPALKAISIDWGAWAEVGMAARGHTPELMKQAGIKMIAPALAAPLVRAELLSGGGEVLLAGALGALEGEPAGEIMDVEKANVVLRAGQPAHAMLSRLTAYDARVGLTLEAELDPTQEPFLKDHALNGIPVLPGVMGIEGFSVAARHIATCLAAECGEMQVTRLEDIHFMAPFKFYRDQPRHLIWKALPLYGALGLEVQVSLESNMLLKTQSVVHLKHFSGRVYLQTARHKQMDVIKEPPPAWNGALTVGPDDIYRLYFHGPAFQVLDGVQTHGDYVIGRLNHNLPPFTREKQPLLSMPQLVELCFQTAGIWQAGKTGVMALPESIGCLTLYHRRAEKEALYAEVQPHQAADGSLSFDARVVDSSGRLYLKLEDYRTVALPYAVEQKLLTPLQQLTAEKN
ncbi:MAG: SDR family NAD(P)-dependent oxidoreductase, partial [Anaerolineae bacterium]|nr:SDR family NAD(P)-dependent oxidoreductase [Anaerolineae bacterium]